MRFLYATVVMAAVSVVIGRRCFFLYKKIANDQVLMCEDDVVWNKELMWKV